MKTALSRFNDKWMPEPYSGCWLWMCSASNTGYGQFWLGNKLQYAHRASWQIYNGVIPDQKCVLHVCDTRLCVNPAHLFVGTQQENIKDCVSKGRHSPPGARGHRHGMSKLTPGQVLQIRSCEGPQRDIGRKFGIHQATVHRIKSRKNWKHL